MSVIAEGDLSNGQGLKEGIEFPYFDPECYGGPLEWNNMEEVAWGKRSSHRFPPFPSREPCIGNFLEFLEARCLEGGDTLLELLEEPQKKGDGWFRTKVKRRVERPVYSKGRLAHEYQGKSNWQTAWHGCKLEALYSLLHSGQLREFVRRGEGSSTSGALQCTATALRSRRRFSTMRALCLCLAMASGGS